MNMFRHLASTTLAVFLATGFVPKAVAARGRGAPPPPPAGATAPSLKTPAPGATVPDADGFITRWLLLDPLPGEGRVTDSATQAAAKKEYFSGQLTILPRDGDKVTVGGADFAWHAVETNRYNVNLYHFGYYRGKPTSDVVFWVVTVINCQQELTGVRLAIGSNPGSVWWVNGQEVVGIYGDRQTVIDDGVSKKITLKKGANIVRGVVVNNGGMVDFCARFLGPDDQPLKSYTISLGEDGK
jgi:hypothetical protein